MAQMVWQRVRIRSSMVCSTTESGARGSKAGGWLGAQDLCAYWTCGWRLKDKSFGLPNCAVLWLCHVTSASSLSSFIRSELISVGRLGGKDEALHIVGGWHDQIANSDRSVAGLSFATCR